MNTACTVGLIVIAWSAQDLSVDLSTRSDSLSSTLRNGSKLFGANPAWQLVASALNFQIFLARKEVVRCVVHIAIGAYLVWNYLPR